MSNLELWKVPLAIFHLCFALMALHILAIVMAGGSPITPELYGPAVYAIDAWIWCAAQIVGELICAFAVWRVMPRLLLVGCSLVLPFYAFLGAAATLSGEGMMLAAGAIWVASPLPIFSILLAVEALKDGDTRRTRTKSSG